ncbi:MAG: hypothetical protein OXE96_12855 [Gemmatimonadetes bacterium]|nr:hypothetical protein [Gemmatimonadota bacterium]
MTAGKPLPGIFVLAASASALAFACAPADQGGEQADADGAVAEAPANPRFGVWQIETERPPPYRNIMTYEPYGDGGMRITVATTNADGETSEWGYVTMFDGEFHPVEGQENATTAVEVVDERTNRILNARNGEVYQVIVNVLSEDGNTIDNEYRRTGEDGTESVSHAVYKRIR